MWIVYSETLPRLGFSLLAAFLIGQGGSLWWYPVLLCVGTVLGVVGFSIVAVRPVRPPARERTRLTTLLSRQSPSAVTTIVGATYAVGAIFLASTVTSTSEIAELSSADRIYRLATVGITIAASLLTPWIAVRDQASGRRARSAILMMSGIGLVGLPAITFLAPVAARILFGTDLEPSRATCLAYGVAFLGVAISTTLGQHYLVPRGREVDYMTGSVLAALVGAPSILLLAARFGATGAAAGLAVSETAIVAVLVMRSLRLHSRGTEPRERRADSDRGASQTGETTP
jgi:O-antigen/teichoic acid export membrane protein